MNTRTAEHKNTSFRSFAPKSPSNCQFLPPLMMVNLSKSWGGGEKWFLTVGEALQKRGFRIVMVAYPGSALHERLQKRGLTFEVSATRFSSLLNPSKSWPSGLCFENTSRK